MVGARVVANCLLVNGLLSAIALSQSGSFTNRPVPGMRQMDRHNPFSRGYVDMTPGGYARRQWFSPGYGYSQYGYSTFYYGSAPLGLGYYYGPPVYFDFGYYPQPWDFGYSWSDPYPPIATAPLPQPLVAPENVEPKLPGKPRPSNPEAVARAARYLTAGDEHFAAQRYRDANARYRTATETAPDLVEAFFRQGQALLATTQYELAGKAFKRGLRLGPKWPQASFDLADLYGANLAAKSAHMEALAAAAGDAPHDGTLWLLVGLELYFDGQRERALPFFRKAASLLADADELNLDGVLK